MSDSKKPLSLTFAGSGRKQVVTGETIERLQGEASAETIRKLTPGVTSADDLLDMLADDRQWIAARAERDAKREQLAAGWREAEKPLLEELRRAGVGVDSTWDLVNTSDPYPEALPILLEHLRRDYPDRVREGMARALAVQPAGYAWDELVSLYRQEPDGTDAKDGLAVAVSGAFPSERFDDLIELAKDREQGRSRILLLRAISRLRRPEATAALRELASDPDLEVEATHLLRGRKS